MFNIFNLFKVISSKPLVISLATSEKIHKDWGYVQTLLIGKSPAQLRQALITADRAFDNALRDLSEGETMAERMKSMETRFGRELSNKIWEAHKVRNSLVHEAGYEPPAFVLIENVQKLKEALIFLGLRL